VKRLALAAFVGLVAAAASVTAYQWASSGSPHDGATVPVRSKAVRIDVSKSAAPTLGIVWAPSQRGWGQVKPKTIDNGGDPNGLVENIRWQGWGKPRAIGIGLGWRPPDSGFTYQSRRATAKVVAWNLGMCRGRLAYRAVDWYFPSYGERFRPRANSNMCTGEYVRSGSRTEVLNSGSSNRTSKYFYTGWVTAGAGRNYAGHYFTEGDAIFLSFSYIPGVIRYRTCWLPKAQPAQKRCAVRTTNSAGFSAVGIGPRPFGVYDVTWYVHARPVAKWSFFFGPEH
jgi:hypothetical protein